MGDLTVCRQKRAGDVKNVVELGAQLTQLEQKFESLCLRCRMYKHAV